MVGVLLIAEVVGGGDFSGCIGKWTIRAVVVVAAVSVIVFVVAIVMLMEVLVSQNFQGFFP